MPHRDERSEWRGDALESTRTADDRAEGEGDGGEGGIRTYTAMTAPLNTQI